LTRFVGLTGGIGAGKSETLAAFERAGAATLSTDHVAHDLLDRGDMRELLVGRWGPDVAPGGNVDRDRVAEIVFEDPDELRWLESQTHPRVGEAVLEWRRRLDPDVELAVVEVPLLFEASMEGVFDATVAVVADDAIRERRLAARGQTGRAGLEGLEGRERRQLDQSEKADRADHVIRNQGTLDDLEREVAALVRAQVAEGAR
jgi:dephospho-CoA kinase